MKPTLFIDDLHDWRERANAGFTQAMLARILPKRCPCFDAHTYSESPSLCMSCPNGLGFEYPDMPDWWAEGERPRGFENSAWESMCNVFWRAMGITE
jgi:hypothetical protein